MAMFRDTDEAAVRCLFSNRQRKAHVIKGFFPASCQNIELGEISFAHIDVDIYQATLDTLEYLAPRMTSQSFMIIDDYRRGAKGVDQAILEFTARHADWRSFPLFPSEALLIHRSWLM
jgi:O-methyltransferase